MPIHIFEALDQIAHGRGKPGSGARPVVDWLRRWPRRKGSARRFGKAAAGRALSRAEGRRTALAAEEPVGADAVAAGDADRRKQEIGGDVQRATEGLRRREELGPRGKNV